MIGRIFEGGPLLFLIAFGLAGFLIGVIRDRSKKDASGAVKGTRGALWGGLEAAVLTIVGGLLARGLVSVLLGLAEDLSKAGKAVGWGFFLVPGAVDAIAGLADEQILTTPKTLLWLATLVGAFAGFMDGIWKIHDWKGLGWLSFPLDMTWGLAGTALGTLLHLINFSWGDHADEKREGAHRYKSGFRLIGDFAFTQGSVMSNVSDARKPSVYSHELTHVWQNRIFGPLFVLSYLGWLLVWFVPGLIAGLIKGAGAGQGILKWCYLNNPWEAVAFEIQGTDRTQFGNGVKQKALIWPAVYIVLWSIVFFAVTIYIFVKIYSAAW